MVIIETRTFTRIIKDLLSDDEYKKLQEALINRPDMGDLIKDSGGLRKVRWKLDGTGKSGGVRVIYYWVVDNHHIRMLFAYPKSVQANLTKEQIAQLKTIIEGWQ
ncbi:MAG TPA: type II toxin-antitoxin system RelE/ParE family toxin [Cellvibrio sp.]